MRDFKATLKQARESIKLKNFELCLRLCKDVLNEDNANYLALVFSGVSLLEMGHLEKSVNYFQRAIASNATNPLAWNGLVNYYEKLQTEESKKQLVQTYLNLLEIENNPRKIAECARKLEDLNSYGEISDIALVLYNIIKVRKCTDGTEVHVSLTNILSKSKTLPADLVLIYEEILNIVLTDENLVSVKYYSEYLNILYKLNRLDELYLHACNMRSRYPNDSTALQWICKIFNQRYIESGKVDSNIESASEALLELDKQSATALFSKSILLYEKDDFLSAKDILHKAIELIPGMLYAWVLNLKFNLRLHLLADATLSLKKIEHLVKQQNNVNTTLKGIITRLTIELLSRSNDQDDLERALALYETSDEDLKKVSIPHVIRAYTSLKNFSKAEDLLPLLKQQEHKVNVYKLLQSQLLHKQGKYQDALNILGKDGGEVCEFWLQIGLIYWDLQDYDKSLTPFLKAAKLEPFNYQCFLFLGNYYKVRTDFDKARRCYEKAFNINSKSSDIGILLSRIYREMKKWEENQRLLQVFTSGVIEKRNAWAFMQLGLQYLEQLDYIQAINNFRIVIRIDEDNMHCWESLADTYLAKGAYTSALKCYEKTLSFKDSTQYPLLQMAYIKQILGEFLEAKQHYEEILVNDKYYIPALKGIAESCLFQAKEYLKDQRLGAARKFTQIAAEYLVSGIEKRPDLACLWKLLGDSCFFTAQLSEKLSCLLLPSIFVGKENGNTVFERNDLLKLTAQCYSKSLSFFDDNFSLWHDLAMCYLYWSHYTDEDLLTKAKVIAEYSAAKNPDNWQHWDLLGNISMKQKNYRLAQHSFIKALEVYPNSAVSWTNLGTLYLMLQDFKLANASFSQAQRCDPNYVNSWVGQGLLAEKLARDEAMDLFRHSTQLGMHKQGALGYAYWVCSTLKRSPLDAVIYSIHNMHAIPIACDALTFYIEQDPLNYSAWNMLGILKERMGLKHGAVEAFKNAFRLAKRMHRDFAGVNYGRALTLVDDYPQAIKILSDAEEASFNSGCSLALALFKNKEYKESYDAYESTLHWLSEESEYQSDILVCLASMAYMFEGVDTTKTLLFQSIQVENPSTWGLFATLALGLLHKDYNLASLVLTELDSIQNKKESLHNCAVLTSLFYFMQENEQKCITHLSKIIHKHPDQAEIWMVLTLMLLRLRGKRAQAASNCARIAMLLRPTNMDLSKVLCFASLSSLIMGDIKSSLLLAKKSIFYFPDVPEGWALLAVGLKEKNIDDLKVKDILKHIRTLNCSKQLHGWIEKLLN